MSTLFLFFHYSLMCSILPQLYHLIFFFLLDFNLLWSLLPLGPRSIDLPPLVADNASACYNIINLLLLFLCIFFSSKTIVTITSKTKLVVLLVKSILSFFFAILDRTSSTYVKCKLAIVLPSISSHPLLWGEIFQFVSNCRSAISLLWICPLLHLPQKKNIFIILFHLEFSHHCWDLICFPTWIDEHNLSWTINVQLLDLMNLCL